MINQKHKSCIRDSLIALVLLSVSTLMGCNPAPVPLNSEGHRKFGSEVYGVAEGCTIYKVDAIERYIYLSKCPDAESTVSYMAGKISTATVTKKVAPPPPPSALEKAMANLSPEDKEQLMVEMKLLLEQAKKD